MKIPFTLAEVTTNVAANNICQPAFTLAEVLITLGIIGIVAAMTLPSLIANYQKKVYVTQLRKTISTIQQGVQKMMADDEVNTLEDTSKYSNMRTTSGECNSPNNPDCEKYYEDFGKYFNIIKFESAKNDYKVSYIDTNDIDDMSQDYYYFLQDGTMIKVDSTTGASNSFAGTDQDETFNVSTWIEFDVNGLKRPNKYGYDVFNLYVSDDGKVYYDKYTKRIMEDGWEINY